MPPPWISRRTGVFARQSGGGGQGVVERRETVEIQWILTDSCLVGAQLELDSR